MEKERLTDKQIYERALKTDRKRVEELRKKGLTIKSIANIYRSRLG